MGGGKVGGEPREERRSPDEAEKIKLGRCERAEGKKRRRGGGRSKVRGLQLPSSLINGFASLHGPAREEGAEVVMVEEASGYDHGSAFENLL